MMYQQRSLPCAGRSSPRFHRSSSRSTVLLCIRRGHVRTHREREREREIGNFLEFHERKGDEVIGLNTRLIRFVGELKGT